MAGESAYYDIRIRVFDKPLDDLERKTDRFERKVGGLGKAFAGAFAATAVLTGVGLLTKKIVGLGAEMEQTRVSFTIMLGSADKANATLKELSKFAIATPFRQGEVVTGAKQLLAYGFTAESLTENLTRLGDVSSGLSIPLGDLVYLYGTVRTQGRAMTKDIMQFANRGIPIYDALNKVTGKYGKELNKAIEDGEITFGTIEQAFKMMTKEGSMFGGLMAKQAKTLAGRWSTFLDVLENTGRSIGERINPALGDMLDSFSNLFNSFRSNSKKFEEQRSQTKNLLDVVNPLMQRYNELSRKIFRTSEESTELKNITKQIADLIPSAVSQWDAYGNAIEISNDKLRENIKLSATKELEFRRKSIQDAADNLEKYADKADRLRSALNQGTIAEFSGVSGGGLMGGGQSVSSRKMTDSELTRTREDLQATTKDLSETFKDYMRLTGQLGSDKLEKLFVTRGLGDVYKNLLKEEIERRQKGIFSIGTSTDGGGSTTTSTTGNSSGGSSKAGVEKISSATRNVTLNITKLIENLNFTKDPAKNEHDMQEMVKRVLLRAVNDVNIVSQ